MKIQKDRDSFCTYLPGFKYDDFNRAGEIFRALNIRQLTAGRGGDGGGGKSLSGQRVIPFPFELKNSFVNFPKWGKQG